MARINSNSAERGLRWKSSGEWGWKDKRSLLFERFLSRDGKPRLTVEPGELKRLECESLQRLAHVARSLRDREWVLKNHPPLPSARLQTGSQRERPECKFRLSRQESLSYRHRLHVDFIAYVFLGAKDERCG